MLTLEEQERRAYIAGDTRTAGLLAQVIDAEEEVNALEDLDPLPGAFSARVQEEVAKIIALA